jgi:hypothetical protein
MAAFGFCTPAQEMLPESSFLKGLNRRSAGASPDSGLCSIFSILDNMVLPNESARMSGMGVTTLETRPVDHLGLLICKHTALLVRKFLDEP